jgi:integrase
MERSVGRLTALKVGSLLGSERRERKLGLHADGGGLYLQVTDGGASWVLRYMLAGCPREMGLGPLALYGLQEARAKALDARRLRHQGIDPIEHRRAHRAALALEAAKGTTFEDAAEAYIKAHRAGWRNAKHAAQWEATLETYAYPIFGKLSVQAIDTGLVMKVLEQDIPGEPGKPAAPLWTARPETASRLRGRIELVLDWAKVRGMRDGENPARWRGHFDKLLPARGKVRKVKHHAALPYGEMAGFMTALAKQDGVSARAFEFAILTAVRTNEIIGARRSEIDRREKVWVIPAERMKGGREHRVPLSTRALAILDDMHKLAREDGASKVQGDGFVFPGGKAGKPLSNMAFLMLLRRMERGDLTAHGFRSTFRDWAAERTSFPREVAEAALAHVIDSKVEAAYRRGDLFEKRCRLMDAWAEFCGKPPVKGSVLSLRQA